MILKSWALHIQIWLEDNDRQRGKWIMISWNLHISSQVLLSFHYMWEHRVEWIVMPRRQINKYIYIYDNYTYTTVEVKMSINIANIQSNHIYYK